MGRITDEVLLARRYNGRIDEEAEMGKWWKYRSWMIKIFLGHTKLVRGSPFFPRRDILAQRMQSSSLGRSVEESFLRQMPSLMFSSTKLRED